MTDAFETNMRIIAGENMRGEKEPLLSDADKKKLSDNYFQLFFNMTYANWLRGRSLGEAWYTAIQQLKQFIASKDGNNHATLYLRQIFASHKAKWAYVMMTSKHRDDILQVSPEQKQKWQQHTAKNITVSLNALNDLIKSHSRLQKDNQKTQTSQQIDLKTATQKMQMLIMMKMQQNQKQRSMVA